MQYLLAYGLAIALFLASGTMTTIFSGVLMVAGIAFGAILAASKGYHGAERFECILKYFIFFFTGVGGLWAGTGHVFFAKASAAAIGWQPSPFQFEVGMANYGFGLAGILAIFFRPDNLLGLITAQSVFLLGASYGHLVQILAGNLSPNNAGVIFYTDILGPAFMLAAYFGLQRARKRSAS